MLISCANGTLLSNAPISCLQQLLGIVRTSTPSTDNFQMEVWMCPRCQWWEGSAVWLQDISVSQQQQQMKTESIFYLLLERAFHSNTKHRWKKWYQLLFKCVVMSAFIHEERTLASSVFQTFGFQIHSCVSLEALLVVKLLTWIGLRAKLFVT